MARMLKKEEKQLWYKFKTPNCNNLQRKKLNQPSISAANTWHHERAKLRMAYDALRNGDLWLMEAEEIKTGRIRDFVNLTQRIIYEFERDKSSFKKKESEGAYESPNCIVEVIKLFK